MDKNRASAANTDLAAAAEALNKAARSLQDSTAKLSKSAQETHEPPAAKGVPAASAGETQGSKEALAAQRFYERLEQTGQLVDVDESTDLAQLSPRITHIRHPDGSIERIGFSSSSYGIG